MVTKENVRQLEELFVKAVQEFDDGGVRKDDKTADYYRTKHIPNKFEWVRF